MSASDEKPIGELLAECAGRCLALVEKYELDTIPSDEFGGLFATLVRVLAEKAQSGSVPALTSGNRVITATDGAIACTAILEAAGIELFELSAWQALTDVGSRRRASPAAHNGAQ